MGDETPANSGSNASDHDLLRRFAAGQRAALVALAERHEQALLGLAQGLLHGDRDAAKDAVQEAWVRVIKSAKHFRSGASVKTWLYRIVINGCLDVRRAATAQAAALNGQRSAVKVSGSAADRASAPPQIQDDKARVQRALERLAPDQRLVLLVCFHHGLSHSEAADVLGWPLGTLKSRVAAAMDAMQRELTKAGEP